MGKYFSDSGNDPFCMGISRFCEWSDDDDTYADLGITVSGACTSHCTSYCNNFQNEDFLENNNNQNVAFPNGCYKCYGMYPGFYRPNDPFWVNPEYLEGGNDWDAFRGPCDPSSQLSTRMNQIELTTSQ